MSDHHDLHAGQRGQQGAPGHLAGRAAYPVVTVQDPAWPKSHKPGPGRPGRSAGSFRLSTERTGI
jgi:hypothetical protein